MNTNTPLQFHSFNPLAEAKEALQQGYAPNLVYIQLLFQTKWSGKYLRSFIKKYTPAQA